MNSRAVASPIPLSPPAMSATLSCSLAMIYVLHSDSGAGSTCDPDPDPTPVAGQSKDDHVSLEGSGLRPQRPFPGATTTLPSCAWTCRGLSTRWIGCCDGPAIGSHLRRSAAARAPV